MHINRYDGRGVCCGGGTTTPPPPYDNAELIDNFLVYF